MSNRLRKNHSVAEYFAIEARSEVKFEYYAGEIVAMTGTSPRHSQIAQNFRREIDNQLEDRDCIVYDSDLRVKIARYPYYVHPDATVACGSPSFETVQGLETLLNPMLIAEVLSPSTRKKDEGSKFRDYKEIDSLQQYLLISQEQAYLKLFTKDEHKKWQSIEVLGLDSEITILNCTLSLSRIYRKVIFPNK